MKNGLDAILQTSQARYLDDLLPERDPILRRIERLAAADDVPISDPEVGRMLELLARAIGARRVVEVGTAIGYGTLCLARGTPEGRVVSIDPDPEQLATARRYLAEAGVLDRVELVQGRATEVLPALDGPVDLAYIDALKVEYRAYLDLLVPKLRPGGLVVMDNLLWQGRLAQPPSEEDDAETVALRAFNRYLMRHPRLLALVLPLGDGLGLATKL